MKYTKLILSAVVAVMLAFCAHLDTYTETATATGNTFTGYDRNGAAVTLTECRTEDGDRLILADVREGHSYRVTLATFGTWSKEDDAIIRIREEARK